MIDFASWNRRERAARWSRHTLYLFLRFSAPLYLDGASILSLLQANAVTLTSTHHLPYLDINLPCYLCYTHVLLCTIRTTRPMVMPCPLPCLLHLAPCFVDVCAPQYAYRPVHTRPSTYVRYAIFASPPGTSTSPSWFFCIHRDGFLCNNTTRLEMHAKPHDLYAQILCPFVRYSCLILLTCQGCD